MVLSALGLNEQPQTYSGGLEDKIVYVHGGHGYTANNLDGGNWGFQRPELFEMIEDLGNYDQTTLFADYLMRAGATVVPLRPIGHQPAEHILDNDDVRVTFEGPWSDSSGSVYFGDPGDVSYRFANTSATETAVAKYQPDISESDFFPVYAWTKSGGNRASDQLYRIVHAGGTTEVTVNHRRVGDGLVYLGTYYFSDDDTGYVEISNRSSESGRVVIADMIRFGNGMGDINRGGGVSGRTREDEAGLYWIQWHVDRSQGISTSEYRVSSNDRSATVSLSPRYAEFMNREADGQLSDRVFVSFHSNAGGGSARGVLGLYNGNNRPSSATPNQELLAEILAEEINDDLVSLNGQFEHNWFDRGNSLTLDRSDIEFGEINNEVIGGEFDATIVETGFHDNQLDAEMLRDPRVRDALARATYQGVVRYFNQVDNGNTPLTFAPPVVDGVWSKSQATGTVTVGWDTPTASAAGGSSATGYRVYASANGYAFDGGTYVDVGAGNSYTFTKLDPQQNYYFHVVAVNQGGESPRSQVVAARPSGGEQTVLFVNGFDRQSRSLSPRDPFGSGNTVDRVRPNDSNSGDYVVRAAESIQRTATQLAISTASNESVIDGSINLNDYDAVIWMSGEESSADDTFNATEQALVANYVAAGGHLFASGAEIAWDLDALNNGESFFRNTFLANYAADDANTYTANGAAGSIFAGIGLQFDDGSTLYDVNFPDVLSARAGGTVAMTYATGGGAAIHAPGTAGRGDVVLLGFPVESIIDPTDRDAVISAVIDSFGLPLNTAAEVTETIDSSQGQPDYEQSGAWSNLASSSALGGTYLRTAAGGSSTANWNFDIEHFGTGRLMARWPALANNADRVSFTVDTGFEEVTLLANQATDGAEWVTLGHFPIAAGLRTVSVDAADAVGGSFVVADGVRLEISNAISASGDFNGDGGVDLADYTIWRNNLSEMPARGQLADANGDSLIDAQDFQWWRAQLGSTTPVANSSQVHASANAQDNPEIAAENTSSVQLAVALPASNHSRIEKYHEQHVPLANEESVNASAVSIAWESWESSDEERAEDHGLVRVENRSLKATEVENLDSGLQKQLVNYWLHL